MNDDGSFNQLAGATDIGTGTDTNLAQMVAETVGCEVEDIVVSVTNQFEVDTERARCDVQEFLSEITRLGLVNQ